MRKQPYSVVLMRPDYMCDGSTEPFGQNCYVGLVNATTPENAVKAAQKEVFKADKRDAWNPQDKEDYYPLLVLDGHVNVRRFGFQL